MAAHTAVELDGRWSDAAFWQISLETEQSFIDFIYYSRVVTMHSYIINDIINELVLFDELYRSVF